MNRDIKFAETPPGMLRVLVDGKLVQDVFFDLKVIHAAVRAKSVSPAMQNGIMKTLKRKLEDSGLSLQQQELQFILRRFEQEFAV
jgi:hypothetical protein